MFEGFERFDITTSVTTINGRVGGDGPPVLLLHDIPETHLMWHRIAPTLAERYTVVATDLRGYGEIGTPPSTADHAPYSMREIARDQIEVMAAMGHDRFAVVGHDRGARCGYRMALDHPSVVAHVAVLDIVPTGDVFRRVDGDLMMSFWVVVVPLGSRAGARTSHRRCSGHLREPPARRMVERSDAFPDDVRTAYISPFRDPDTVHAICEEYRAAATLDRAHDEADRDRRRIRCPVLVLWSHTGWIARWDPLAIWQTWADDVRGAPVAAGHFLPEEAPDATLRSIVDFVVG